MQVQCIKFIVSGRVQGVGFRYNTAYHGLKLGVTGYAKNLWDGDVEVVVRGNVQQIEQMEQFLQQGPRMSRVDSLHRETTELKEYKGFDIL
ncbi:acylphosphatase [Vibrio sp. LaRot3]|uniref:acylphosphatase n=1 Tax=Vibrio sp. LaRot3 TaxID=2998829 RepID=UPI0022CE17D0|nr:acylphosphatase [Vibrio sp. LaRot3]MDA0147499.1 acylphosphatase [Vibrio sp. LaRot3]